MACADAYRLIEQGQLEEARACLERDIHGGDLSRTELAEAYSAAALVHTRQGDYYAAVRCGESALRLAREEGAAALETLARFRLGTALTFLGDTPEAMDQLREFLARAEQAAGHGALAPRAHFNLGINHMRRREYAAALEAYRRAAELFLAAGAPDRAARSWRETAWCLMLLDRAGEALPWLQRVEEYLAGHPDDVHIRNVLLVDWALYHHHHGDVARSMAFCQAVFQPGRSGVTAEHLAQAAWVAGLNALELGHPEESAMFAETAMEQALRARWPFMINQANALRRRISGTSQGIGA